MPPRQINPQVHRDLESVCLKCLEKVPHRRYDSAAALADDLRRFLNGQATRARPLPAWRRGWRELLRRPRLGLAASAGLLALFALSGAWWYVDGVAGSAAALSADADTARQERDRVEAEANAARQRLYAREVSLLAEAGDEARLSASQLASVGPEELRGFEWHFLRRGVGTEPGSEWFVERGHSKPAVRVAFSPNGQLCASAGDDEKIAVWKLATLSGRSIGTHSHVNALAFSPDGKTLVSGGGDDPGQELKLWDVATGVGRASFSLPGGGLIIDLAFAPDGRTLALSFATGYYHQLLLWDVHSERCRELVSAEAAWRPALAFSPDGHTLTVGCGRGPHSGDPASPRWGAIQLFDVATGKLTAMLTGYPALVQWVAFTPDGKSLVGGAVEDTVKVWDVSTRGERLTFHAGTHLALAPDGNTLAVVRGGREIQLWDVASGRSLVRIGSVPSQIHGMRFDPAGTQLAVACDDGTVRLFDARNIHDLPGHRPAEAWAVAFAPDGKTLASAGDDHVIRLWSVPGFKQQAVLRGHASLIASVAFSPDGRTLASGSFDQTVRLWDAATGREKAVLRGHAKEIRAVGFSPDGRWLASFAKSVKQVTGELKLWDVGTGNLKIALPARGTCVSFSANGLLAFQDDHEAVSFLDVSTLKQTHGIPGVGPVSCLTLAPDSQTLATGHEDGMVKLWDVNRSEERSRLLPLVAGDLRALAFSPDGKTVASAGTDKTIRLWQAATGLELFRFKNLPEYAHSLSFSPDGTLLAAALHDGTVRIYLAGHEP